MIQGGDISFLPGLEEFVNRVLRNSVLEQYTLPGGFTLPIAPGGGHEVGSRAKQAVQRCATSCAYHPHALAAAISCQVRDHVD